jgi:subtilisin family serine protease
MPHADLPRYQEGFFQKFLAELPGSPARAALEQQQPANTPLSLLGEYVRYSGAAITPVPNASIAPQFAIRTEAGGAAQTYVLIWIIERLDVATDSKETMARILADFRRPATGGTTQTEGLGSELAGTWANALSTDAVRQALAVNLSTLTTVPGGLPTTDLTQLKTLLLHFGTYKPNGDYYAKGTVAEGQFPQGVAGAYLAPDTGNVAEILLPRQHFYCSALVSARLWNPRATASSFRQLVYRIEDQGEEAADRYRLALLHTAAVSRPDGVASNRFIFFHAPVGAGLEIPEGAAATLAPSTASFLEQLPAYMADVTSALKDPDTPLVGTTQAPYVLLLGAVTQDFPRTDLPEGVIVDGTGAIRTFRCPPPKVIDLAARPDIQEITLSTPVWLDMADVKRELNLAARTFPAGVTAANTGQGVVVGIVDSGIDGSHPAFLGRQDDATKSRIHSVWNLWESGGQSPFQRSGQNDAYRSMSFGKEYIGHNEVTTVTDAGGHGTHVSGIAAGRPVGAWPGGIAPAATLVVAAVGSQGGYVNDIIVGVKYCFQKATELGLPCVVNISLGTERHSHDGTDPMSVGLMQLVSANYIPAVGIGALATAMPEFLQGRVICAAAGNNRGTDLHWQATIPANGDVSVLYRPVQANDGITFWAYNEDATTVRLRISARDSANPVLATPEAPLQTTGGAVTTNLPGGLRVNIHNGPVRPNNRHFNPEIYWVQPTPPVALGPWIVRLRNTSQSPCMIHGFAAFREHRGRFVFAAAQTQPLIGVTYTPAQLSSFDTHKVSTPGTSPGVISVAAFTSRAGLGVPVGDLAPFSSPGPLRAAGPGRRAIDVAAPGHTVRSAQAGTGGFVDMSGTSMATPTVTGLVAALLQMNRNYNTGDIKTRLELACRRRPADTVDDWGMGRIDAAVLLRP